MLVQNDGNVTATFQGSNAGYVSSLFLGSTKIFTTSQSTGSSFDLGHFTAGTELVFRLEVHNTGHTFFSGGASNNIDGIAHAYVNDTFGANETLVSFEDLLGGGDRDYNDLIFSFSNTNTEVGREGGLPDEVTDPNPGENLTQTPEPSTMILFGSGLASLIAWRHKKKGSIEK